VSTESRVRARARTRSPLSWRAELRRQLGRRRTVWSLVLVIALPLVLVAAFALGSGGPPTGSRFVDLARLGSANFTIFAFFVSAELLLVILAALFVGDSVPAEASWSSLRYLLTAPVPRARLLTSKLVVGLATVVAAVLLLVGWSLLVGGVSYGWAPLQLPTGGSMSWGEFVPRLALCVAYVVTSLVQVASIAFWLGTRTDAPLAAVGGSVLVTILGGILAQIDALGDLRRGLPLYYQRAWLDVLNPTFDVAPLRHGALWSLLYAVVFIGLGYRHFRRKDILS
jgi:ABC-2 type transport system permease protein